MNLPQACAGRRCDPDQEGKRQVPLLVTNAVFSKLIKLGDPGKKTPVAVAQELFEEAYAARCMGRGVDGSPADRLKPGEALADELAERLRQQLAESGRETARANIEAEEERQAHAATRTALAAAQADAKRVAHMERVVSATNRLNSELTGKLDDERRLHIKTTSDLAEAQRERDELSKRCWNVERELDELRKPPVPVTVDPPEPGEVPAVAAMVAAVRAGTPILTPAAAEALELPKVAGPEPCPNEPPQGGPPDHGEKLSEPPAIGKGTVKAVLAMRSMGATAAEIASDLALLRPIVDQVLRENGA